MGTAAKLPLVSVIIPTFNRGKLLQAALESLANQTLPRDQYEVIVVDDGSIDSTPEACKGFSSRMSLKYFRIQHSGISAAKNLGVFTSTGSMLLFFDDDDVADENLVQEHLKTHQRNPQDCVAVLGYTSWAPSLQVTEVMDYVTDTGRFLFSYSNLSDGQVLDFTYFWGGRTSCKRSLLVKHGVFNQEFHSIIEDIELGYRLSKFGLKVVFNRNAISYMARTITCDEFCRRCESQGKGLYLLSRLHSDFTVQNYCQGQVRDPNTQRGLHFGTAAVVWRDVEEVLADKVHRVHELESLLASRLKAKERELLLGELRGLYRWIFNSFKVKGVVEAMRADGKIGGRMFEEVAFVT